MQSPSLLTISPLTIHHFFVNFFTQKGIMYKYVKRILQGISLRLFIEILLFLGSLIVFAFIANEIVLQNEKALDDWGFSKVKPLVSPGMTSFMKIMTFFGYWYFVMPAFLIVIAWFLI